MNYLLRTVRHSRRRHLEDRARHHDAAGCIHQGRGNQRQNAQLLRKQLSGIIGNDQYNNVTTFPQFEFTSRTIQRWLTLPSPLSRAVDPDSVQSGSSAERKTFTW
jgi:hypothetical protein